MCDSGSIFSESSISDSMSRVFNFSNTDRLLLVVSVVVLLSACEHANPVSTDPPAPTLTSIQNSIFNSSCAISGCHLGANSPRGLDMSPGESWSNLVNVQSSGLPTTIRVVPGDPDNSYLIMKMEGAPGIVGLQMPQGRDPLSDSQIEAIREWIAAGALDN